MRKILIIIFCLLSITILGLRFQICGSFAFDKIVAIVNDDVITQKDLDDFLNFTRLQMRSQYQGKELESRIQEIKVDLLNRLIEDRLILQEARREKTGVEEGRVKARIDEIRARYPSDIHLQQALSQQGLSQADIENKIREQMLSYGIIDSRIKSKIIVTPKEVTDFYESNYSEFVTGEERQLELVAVNDPQHAEEVYLKLKAGGDFAQTASELSLSYDTISVRKNGQLNKEIEEAVFGLPRQEVSRPMKLQEAYYIFRVNEVLASRQEKLLDCKERIFSYLFDKKMQDALARWLDELKTKSYIKVLQS